MSDAKRAKVDDTETIDGVDVSADKFNGFRDAIQAAVSKLSKDSNGEKHLTEVLGSETDDEGNIKLRLAVCQGDACEMKQFFVTSDNTVTEGWPAKKANANATSLRDIDLEKKSGEKVTALSALSGKIVALYFSAHWCPPCQTFTPKLKAAYEEAKAQNKDFEVVFVSSDTSGDALHDYMQEMHGDWVRIPFDDGLRNSLKTKYGAFAGKEQALWPTAERNDGIPCLIIVGPNGEQLDFDARDAIDKDGAKAIDAWSKFKWPSPDLKSCKLETKGGASVSALSALSGKVVALYFSAHWCPPCQAFTPKLKAAYEEAKAQNKDFEVVFVSSDTSGDALHEYMQEMHGDWVRIPFDDGLRNSLKTKYGAFAGKEQALWPTAERNDGIPCLIIVGPNGEQLDFDARDAIDKDGAKAIDAWSKFKWPSQ